MAKIVVTPYGWDMGLNFKEVEELLLREIDKHVTTLSTRRSKYFTNLAKKRLLYLSVLLTQLYNGCRVSEACEAILKWLRSGDREVKVKVRKRRDGYERLIVIPSRVIVLRQYLEEFKDVNVDELTLRVKVFASRTLKINTHALRYAWITYMARELKEPAQIIAKISGHKKLDYILHYVEKKEAEEILRKIVK